MFARKSLQVARIALGIVVCAALLFGDLPPAGASGVCYVKSDASGLDNGSSWQDAFRRLQAALAAPACTEIWVAAGTYLPAQGTNRTISFVLKNGVALYGGFAGNETLRSQRDPQANVTFLSGEIGDPASREDNSHHVLVGSGTGPTAVLDGFTVTAGHGDAGGGMYNDAGSPSLINVIFENNSAIDYGGGMYNANGSSPSLVEVTFRHNIANDEFIAGSGGGMYNSAGSRPSLENVLFIDNWAYRAGGMYNNDGSSPSLKHVIFRQNVGEVGGGMLNTAGSSPTLEDVFFDHNQANFGAGMHNTLASNPTLMNVTLSGGWGETGSGMLNSQSSPMLVNVTITGNGVGGGFGLGGGMYNGAGSNPVLTNVTISGNYSEDVGGGGGIYNHLSSPIITNSIIYGNMEGDLVNEGSNPSVSYSIVGGGYAGPSNLDADPLLGPLQDNGGFTPTMALAAGSPAIDAGDDASCPAADQRGVTRPQGAGCDLGAYEYEQGGAAAVMTFRSGRAQDGWILESGENSGTGGRKNALGTRLRLGDTARNRQYRAVLSFNTSRLPRGAVITAMRLRIKKAGAVGTDPFTTHGDLEIDIRKGSFSRSPALQLADFSAAASQDEAARFGSLPAGGWYEAVFPEAAFAWVNRAGITQLRLRFDWDDNDDFDPDYVKFFSGNAEKPSNRPELIIEYYLP